MFCGKCGKPMSEREEMLKDGKMHIIAACFDCNVQKDIGVIGEEECVMPIENIPINNMHNQTTPMYNRQYVMPGKVVQEVRIKKCINWGKVCIAVIALLVIFAVLIATGNTGADTNKKTTVQNNNYKVNSIIEEFTKENARDLFEVVNEYSFENSIATVHIFIVKNTSNKTITIDSISTALGTNGEVIGDAKGAELNALGAGCTSLIYEYYCGVTDVKGYETTFTISETKKYDSIIQDIQIEKSIQPEKVIVTLTNTGTEDAEFVEAHAIFFKDGEVVAYRSSHVVDADICIKSGATLSEKIYGPRNYDEVKVYITGRK